MNLMNKNQIAALSWLTKRRSIIPIDPSSKRPLIQWKEFQTRLPSTEEVSQWWNKWPNAKLGLVCGAISGNLAVLDIDDVELGVKLLEQLQRHCPINQTPSGGLHIFFREEEVSHSGPLISGVADIKAEAGYVIVPPSEGYQKLNDIHEPLSVPNLREYAETLLAGHGYTVQAEKPNIDLSEKLAEGSRNDTLTRIAGQLRRDGMSEDDIYETIMSVNKKRCDPALADDEVRSIAHSVSRYEPKNPQPPKGLPVGGDPIKLYTPQELVAIYEKAGSQESFKLLGQEGYIFRGWTTLLSGYAKSGKTTLLSQFLRGIAPVKALYIAEEPPAILGERIKDTAAVFSHVTFAPALNKSLEEIVLLVRKAEAEVIVIDTIRNLLQIRDENDNSIVVQRLVPIIGTAREDSKTLILCHHTRKGGGQYSEGAAGAGAFMGLVDVGLEIRRDSYDSDSPRREIHGWGRLHLIEPLSYQLTNEGILEPLGSPQSVRKEAVKVEVLELLGPDKVSTKQVWDSMGEGRPSQEQVRRALVELAEDRAIIRDDSGKTHYFHRPPTEPPTISHEGEAVGDGVGNNPKTSPPIKDAYVVGDSNPTAENTPISNESPIQQPEREVLGNAIDVQGL